MTAGKRIKTGPNEFVYVDLDYEWELYNSHISYHRIKVYDHSCTHDRGVEVPLEVIKYETEEEALRGYREICEKYRMKRNPDNKDGRVVQIMRKRGIDARVRIDGDSRLREGITVYYRSSMYNSIQSKSFLASDIKGTPEDVAQSLIEHLCIVYKMKLPYRN